MCMATRELEQAVSTVTLGPRKSKKNESRFEASAIDVPVEAYRLFSSPLSLTSSP